MTGDGVFGEECLLRSTEVQYSAAVPSRPDTNKSGGSFATPRNVKNDDGDDIELCDADHTLVEHLFSPCSLCLP